LWSVSTTTDTRTWWSHTNKSNHSKGCSYKKLHFSSSVYKDKNIVLISSHFYMLLKHSDSIKTVFDWQYVCYVWETCFSTDSRHSHGYQLFLLADLFLYSFEVDHMQCFLKKNERKLQNVVRFFNFTVRYIDDVLSLKQLADFVDRIFHWDGNKWYHRYS